MSFECWSKSQELVRRSVSDIRSLRSIGFLLTLTVGFSVASAQPSETTCAERFRGARVTWIVPHGIGGGYDTYSRLIEPFLEEATGASITVKNVTGGGGIIGARQLASANPDGLTLGILSATGLMTAGLTADRSTPDPTRDFTVLGRVASTRQIWAAGSAGIAGSMDALIRASETRPIIFATRDVASTGFVNIAVTSSLLGIPHDMVAGYDGSRAAALAAIRGEVDAVAQNFESILPQIVDGELVPLLQVTSTPIKGQPELDGVPTLGGPNGLAVGRIAASGRSREGALEEARALEAFLGAGRIVAAPNGLDADTRHCLERAVQQVLTDQRFREAASKARRSLAVADAAQTRADLESVSRQLPRFREIIEKAAASIRE